MSDSFDQGDGKGKGKVLRSIFRASREYEELIMTWARREDGTLATAHEDVEGTVRSFFEKWFKSRVPVEERWGTRTHFDELDTSQMKVLRRKVALEIHRSKICLQSYPVELINADSTIEKSKTITGWDKSSVAWGVGV